MSAFYERMQGIVKRLTTKYGSTAQIISIDQYNTETILDSPKGVMGVLNYKDLPNTLIENCQGVLYVHQTTGFTPSDTHYVRFNGKLYKIMQVGEYTPSTETVLHALYLSK